MKSPARTCVGQKENRSSQAVSQPSAGEPLNFAEVLASNPDWADQNADQSTDPEEQGEAQALDSSRNPGGGAEPASADVPLPAGRPALDRSLLDEALKLTG